MKTLISSLSALRSMGLVSQFASFLVVGASATAVQYAILIAGVELGGLSKSLSSSIGYLFGALLNYALNYRYTFRSAVPHAIAVRRFAVIVSAGLLLNLLGMMILAERLKVPYILAQVLTTGAVLIWNFVGNKCWSFAQSGAAEARYRSGVP